MKAMHLLLCFLVLFFIPPAPSFPEETMTGVFEISSQNFKEYPYPRPPGKYNILGTPEYSDVLKRVAINVAEVKLNEMAEKYKETYLQHLNELVRYVSVFIGKKEYNSVIDDALFYAYTFQYLDNSGTKILNKEYVNNIAIIKKHFPKAIEYTFWPPTQDGMQINGLYVGGSASNSVIQLSLLNTFVRKAITDVLKKQKPDFKYDGGYEETLGQWASNLSVNMSLIGAFIHENTHAVFQFYSPRGYGSNGNSTMQEATFLFEGVTEMCSHRAVYYLAGGHEDFNELVAYPGNVLTAEILFSIDPEGLYDWYTRKQEKYDEAFAESIAEELSKISSVNDETKQIFDPKKKKAFTAAFIDKILKGNAKSVADVLYPFELACNMKFFLHWIMLRSPYWVQIPLKHRLFILDNFFGMAKIQAKVLDDYKMKVKNLLAKSKRENWQNQEPTEILGYMEDENATDKKKATNILIMADYMDEEPQIGEDGIEGIDPTAKLYGGGGYVEDGPDEINADEQEEILVPGPGPSYDPDASLPNVEEWFTEYRKKARPKDKQYLDKTASLIKDFDMNKVADITQYLIVKEELSGEIEEWFDFLNEYLAPHLEYGKDSLRIHELDALRD